MSLVELVELAEVLAPFAREREIRERCQPLIDSKRLVDRPSGRRWLPPGSAASGGGGGGGADAGAGARDVNGSVVVDRIIVRRRERRNTFAGGELGAVAADGPVVHEMLQSFVALESWGDRDRDSGEKSPALPPSQDELSKLHSRVLKVGFSRPSSLDRDSSCARSVDRPRLTPLAPPATKHLLLRFPTTINKVGRRRTRSLLGADLFAARLQRESEMKQARAEMRRVGRVKRREKVAAVATRCEDRDSPSFGVATYPLEALKRGVAWPA